MLRTQLTVRAVLLAQEVECVWMKPRSHSWTLTSQAAPFVFGSSFWPTQRVLTNSREDKCFARERQIALKGVPHRVIDSNLSKFQNLSMNDEENISFWLES